MEILTNVRKFFTFFRQSVGHFRPNFVQNCEFSFFVRSVKFCDFVRFRWLCLLIMLTRC